MSGDDSEKPKAKACHGSSAMRQYRSDRAKLTVSSRFVTGAELDALLNQINVTLDTTDINMPVTWETEDKRLTSVWTVTEDYQKQDLSCRKMTLETVKAGETSRVTYGFCKMDENWLFDLE